MNLASDLAWQNVKYAYGASIAHQYARYALALDYKMIPPNVMHQAKRFLLDTLGCAIGAYEAPGRSICESVARQLGGSEEATIFCSGLRTNPANATLVNSFMVRFLDYNAPNSEGVPAVLAVAEREKAGGRDFLTALIVSYELGSRVSEAVKGIAIEKKGWTSDIRGGLNMPPAMGKLMKMDEEQIANAIGICASGSLPLNILDADSEENVMRKNLRFGWVAFDAVVATMLAKEGFTGPIRVIEGDSGWIQVILKGDMDVEKLLDFSGWRFLKQRFKAFCLNASTMGHVSATLAIVKEQDLKPADIASVRVRTSPRDAHHTSTVLKKYPKNAESADHSSFYANAYVIKERNFGPDSIKPENFTDPVILDLIDRITVEGDPAMPDSGFEGKSEITTRDGRKFEKHVVLPRGFRGDPLTDKDLEAKFSEMASKHMGAKQIEQIFDAVWNLEKLDDVGKLTKLMVFQSR